MKVLKVITIAAALSAVTGAAMADSSVVHEKWAFDGKQLIPSGVRAEVGTTGYGGALLWDVNPYVGLALGYNGGDISWSDDLKIDGTKYDLDMDNKTAYLNVEMRPWGTNDNRFVKSLYVAAGAAYIDNDYDLSKNVSGSNTTKINGNFYKSANGENGSVRGKMKYDNDIAPYLGFGVAPQINKNFGVFAEVGAYYTGNPTVNLVASNLAPESGGNLANDLAAEEKKIEDKDKYEWLPVGKVGVSYRW